MCIRFTFNSGLLNQKESVGSAKGFDCAVLIL